MFNSIEILGESNRRVLGYGGGEGGGFREEGQGMGKRMLGFMKSETGRKG